MRLTRAQVAKISGYVQKSKQVAWLESYGIKPPISRDGHPVVTWRMIDNIAMGGAADAQPDFGAR